MDGSGFASVLHERIILIISESEILPGAGSIGRPGRSQSMMSQGCHRFDPVTIGLMVTVMATDGGA